MVGFLVGMQSGYTKYQCYICLWDSRADALHYQQHSWPKRREFQIGQHNVKNKPIVEPDRVLMPPLHIKLGLMKQLVKALPQDSEAFQYLKSFFPKLSEAKIKAGIFVGPQIKKIMASEKFLELLSTPMRNKRGSASKQLSIASLETRGLRITKRLFLICLTASKLWVAECHLKCTCYI